jgi:hypothetical protein
LHGKEKPLFQFFKKNNDHGLDVSIVIIIIIQLIIIIIMAFKTIAMKYVYNGIYITLFNKVISYN